MQHASSNPGLLHADLFQRTVGDHLDLVYVYLTDLSRRIATHRVRPFRAFLRKDAKYRTNKEN